MTAQTPTPTLSETPLDRLYIHAMNPRQTVTDQMVEDKATSLAVAGLMQNLLGYRDPATPDRIGIVAGGLRLRGLQKLAAEGWNRHPGQHRIDAAPVLVTDDPLLAQAWAAGENIGREELSPADEVRAYRAMQAQGSSPDMIARAFGRPGAHVARRLKLASLPDTALDALAQGRISLDVAKALTLARDDGQLAEVLEMAIARDLPEWQVRRALTPDTIQSDERRARYVGLPAYLAEGGTMTEDLFSDAQVLHDEALIDRLFRARLQADADRLREDEGWHQVVPLFDTQWIDYSHTDHFERVHPHDIVLPEADTDELEELEHLGEDGLDDDGRLRLHELRERARGWYDPDDVARGTTFVCVGRRGDLRIERGYVPKARKGTGADGVSVSGGGEKPLLPANLLEDLHRIRLAAMQQALLDRPELALDLLAYQIETACPAWRGAFAVTFDSPHIEPAVASSTHIDARLAAVPTSPGFGNEPTAAGLAEFQAKGKKHRNRVLTHRLARSVNALSTGGLVTALRDQLLTPDIRAIWTPDAANFFGRVRPDYLDRIWADLLDLADDDARREEFARLKKAAKAAELESLFADASVQEAHGLSRAQIARIDAWLPEELGGENAA